MSSDEKATAIGRLVLEAAESKKKAAALRSNLERMSRVLQTASLHINAVIQEIKYPGSDWEAIVRAIPTPDAVLALATEYTAESKRATELKSRVAEFGV